MSGGQRQLIALTRILIGNNRVLLLDEPTASMDETTEGKILTLLQQTVTKEQTLIVVTHKPKLLNLVDRVIVMSTSGITYDGTKEAILKKMSEHRAKKNNHE